MAALMTRLGIQYPIIQAPMAGVSTPQLAAAVSAAGGLGSIAIGAAGLAAAETMIRATRALTRAPFNVNVFCHQPASADATQDARWLDYLRPFFAQFNAQPPAELHEIYPSFLADNAVLHLLLAEKPALVSFHFGLPPSRWIQQLQDAGIVTLACVTSLSEALAAQQAGVDALVAQGIEAGGHRGIFDPQGEDEQLPALALLAQLRERVALPLIAAGGIMNGADIAAALAAGAEAVQMGTAFIACPESAANEEYRRRLQSHPHTQITRVISGRPARGIINRMMTGVDSAMAPPVPPYPNAYDAGKALHAAAAAAGCYDFAAHWAGTGVAGVRVLPAAQLLQQLVDELRSAQG